MDVAMALATLFLILLCLCLAAISLLLCLCLAALRPTRTPSSTTTYSPAASDPETPPQQQQELALLVAPQKTKTKPKEPRRLAWREVEALTGGFDEATVVGRGGSGNAVYLARQRVDGSPAAVKVHRWCGGGERRLAAFRRELDLSTCSAASAGTRGSWRSSHTPTTTRREAHWCWSTCPAAHSPTASTAPPGRSLGATACASSTTSPSRWSTCTTPSASCAAMCRRLTCSSMAPAPPGSATWARPARPPSQPLWALQAGAGPPPRLARPGTPTPSFSAQAVE